MSSKLKRIFRAKKARVLSVALAASLLCTMIPAVALADDNIPTTLWRESADTSWFDANNKQETYTLSTPEQLAGFANSLLGNEKESFAGITIKLGADIDLAGHKWLSGGVSTTGVGTDFKGIFDGCGFTIDNLIMSTNVNGAAFIRSTTGATIKNVKFTNVNIFGNQSTAVVYGFANAATLIDNVSVQGTISATGGWNAGIAANVYSSTIQNCRVDMDIRTSQNGTGYGLLCAYVNESTISNCTLKGVISSSGYAAGAIAMCENSQVSDVYVNASIVAKGDNVDLGGLIGYSNTNTVSHCFTAGRIIHQDKSSGGDVGGIAGEMRKGTLEKSYTVATVQGESDLATVGGLVGLYNCDDSATSVIKECGVLGSVGATDGCTAGGFVGEFTGRIENCFSTAMTATGGQIDNAHRTAQAGGFAGKFTVDVSSDNYVKNCFATGQVQSGRSSDAWGQGVRGGRFIALVTTTGKQPVYENSWYNSESRLYTAGNANIPVTEVVPSKTEAEMKSADFVSLLNGDGSLWSKMEDTYPMLVSLFADYTQLNELLEDVAAMDKDQYVDFTAVDDAVAAVDSHLLFGDQATVDGYIDTIQEAIDSLVLKDEPTTDEPTTDEPATDEPTTNAPGAEESTTQAPDAGTTTEKPAAGNPDTGDNVAIATVAVLGLSAIGTAAWMLLSKKRKMGEAN